MQRISGRTRFVLNTSGMLFAVAPSGCDWREFDLEDSAPVVLLSPGKGVRGGFGRSLATQTDNSRVILLVGGDPGNSASAVYSLGTGQEPGQDSSQGGYCSSDNDRLNPCFTANNAVSLPLENTDQELDICFVYAWGMDDSVKNEGLLARCQDSADVTLKVDAEIVKDRAELFDTNEEQQPLFFGADRAREPALVAGLPNQRVAWFYGPDVRRQTPVTLELPDESRPPPSFGSQVSIAKLGEAADAPRLIAVSAPEAGQLWLFRSDKSSRFREAPSVGCVGFREAFGRTMTSGPVDADDYDDLVVADEGIVTVFSGAALDRLPPAYESGCSFGALPAESIIASFTCGSRLALAGCDDSNFGASLAVGDIDGDGDGEIIVGAPAMSVNGEAEAGAVLIYDAEGENPEELSDVLYISSAEKGDRLGSSVTTVRQKSRDVVAAGAPGGSKVAVFYCSDLLPDKAQTGRCQQ